MSRPSMKTLLALALVSSLSATTAAQERIARVGYLSWQDSGAYYESTLKGFTEGLRDEGYVEGQESGIAETFRVQ